MDPFLHRIVGIHPPGSGRVARAQILPLRLAPRQIRRLEDVSAALGQDSSLDSDDVPKDLLRDGASGPAVGTAAGAGVSIALAVAKLPVLIARSVLGALYLPGRASPARALC